MHFSASTFLAPYLHLYYAVMQIMCFFGAIWDRFAFRFAFILCSNADFFGAIWEKFALRLKKFMQKQHHLIVLFKTNLLKNISTKAVKKAPYLMPD